MNDFLPFATGGGANVMTQADYAAWAARVTGFPKGLLPSAKVNKVWRQPSFVAAAVAKFIEDTLGVDVLDNGNLSAFATQLANAITALAVETAGAMIYQGTWDADDNDPALVSSVGTKGFLYTVSVAGATDLDGIDEWNVGDKAVFNGDEWEKIEGQANEVLTVAGRVGNVVLTPADISALNGLTILGNNTGGAGPALALTAEQTKTLLAIAYDDVAGLGTAAQQPVAAFDAAGAAATALAAALAADLPVASQAEAEAASINNEVMTPLRVGQAIAKLAERLVTISEDATAELELSVDDANTYIRMTSAAPNTVVVQLQADAPMPANAKISGIQAGAGQTTIVAAPGVTINATPELALRAQYSAWTLIYVGDDEWDLAGDLAGGGGGGGSELEGFTGASNTGLGAAAGDSIDSGTDNSLVGVNAGTAITSGSDNVAVGKDAMSENTTGSSNVAVGDGALGLFAGETSPNGSNNTCVGWRANVDSAAAANRTAIGSGAVATQNNAVFLGNGAVTAWYMGSSKRIGVRDTGWTVWTGSPDKATALDVATANLAQVAGRVAALQLALTTHGLLGV